MVIEDGWILCYLTSSLHWLLFSLFYAQFVQWSILRPTNINTFLTNFTALKQPQLISENLNTFEYQKLDQHLQAGLPITLEKCSLYLDF